MKVRRSSRLKVMDDVNTISSNLKYISGPVMWYAFDFMGRRFHFFGDRHESMEKNCTELYKVPCSYVDYKGEPQDVGLGSGICYDITYVFKVLFENSLVQRIYTDFMLEIPYRKDEPTFSRATMLATKLTNEGDLNIFEKSRVQQFDYIHYIDLIFNNCFKHDKQLCPYYPYVRFHYTDIRKIEHENRISRSILGGYVWKTLFDHSVSLIMSNFVDFKPENENKPRIKKSRLFIETAVKLIDRYLMNNDEVDIENVKYMLDYRYEVFDMLLNSDDYTQDMEWLLDYFTRDLTKDQLEVIHFPKFKEYALQLSKKVNGKDVSRIKAQYDNLYNDNIIYNGQNMADLIKNFIMDEYNLLDYGTMHAKWLNFVNTIYRRFLLKTPIKNISKYYLKYEPNLVSNDSLYFDMYTLPRMFRQFKINSKIPHNESTLILTYTGAHHTERYVTFFKNYLKLDPIAYVDREKGNRCLYNPDFPQAFI